jgi:FAD/FMN-containing dehydrogenase
MQETLGNKATLQVDEAALLELRASVRGAVLAPRDPGYDEARRIWNGMIDKRPSLIVRPHNAVDVMAAVRFASERGLEVSVRGGGHNIAGTSVTEGGVMIDMSLQRAVRADPANRVVRVEGGATWGDVDRETQGFGLVAPSGIVSTTGVAGFTLGGGFGWTSRKFGFAADNLLSVNVVTAGAQLIHASERENADLFWALRGGGGNFGVVTTFEFRTHRHGPDALCGMAVYPLERGQEVIRRFSELTKGAPDELSALLILRIAPPLPFLPTEVHGTPIAAIAVHWIGDVDAGEAALAPIRAGGQPIADTIALKPFIAHQTMLDAGAPFGRRYYWKSDNVHAVDDTLGEALIESARAITSPSSAILLMHLGGAPARLDASGTAVGMRRARYALNFQAAWDDRKEDRRHIAWARKSLAMTKPFAAANPYVNFLTADETDLRGVAAYEPAIYERLREVKTKYDPKNLFQGAHTIPPK